MDSYIDDGVHVDGGTNSVTLLVFQHDRAIFGDKGGFVIFKAKLIHVGRSPQIVFRMLQIENATRRLSGGCPRTQVGMYQLNKAHIVTLIWLDIKDLRFHMAGRRSAPFEVVGFKPMERINALNGCSDGLDSLRTINGFRCASIVGDAKIELEIIKNSKNKLLE